MQKNIKLTVIILTHNEEVMLPGCIESVSWADEILVIDKKSNDKTVEIAKKHGATVHHFNGEHFDQWRTEALKHATGEWILYVDPDERVTKELQDEITIVVNQPDGVAYRIPRKNYWWGKEFKTCNAYPDYVTRLMRTARLKAWKGIIHESPVIDGEIASLNYPLIHLTHRDLISGLRKSFAWTTLEAQLLFDAGHPSVTWWRLAKVAGEMFLKKYFVQGGFKQGTEGFIESAVQAWNRFMVYEQLWEMQQNLPGKYNKFIK